MKITPKTIIRWCVPSGIYEAAHVAKSRFRRGEPKIGEWICLDSWRDCVDAWVPYSLVGAAEHVAAENEAVQTCGIAALEDDSAARSNFVAFAYVVERTSGGRSEISILDYGGNLGAYSLIARRSAPETKIVYTVRDLPAICRAGRRLRPELIFADSDADLDARYDLAFASGALQYFLDWRATMALLAERASPWLYVTRLFTLSESPSQIVGQRFSDGIVPSWLINRDDLLAEARRAGLRLVEEIACPDQLSPIRGFSEIPRAGGFLFSARR